MVLSACALMALGLYRAPTVYSVTPPPIHLNLIGSSAAPDVQATVYSMDSCAPCRRFVADILKEMPKDGWIVRTTNDQDGTCAHILLTKDTPAAALKIEAFPTTIIRRDGKEVKRIIGQVSPTVLADEINRVAKGSE